LEDKSVQYCVLAPTDCGAEPNNNGKRIANFPKELNQMGRIFAKAWSDKSNDKYTGENYFKSVGQKARSVHREGKLQSGEPIFFEHIWKNMIDLVWDMSKPKGSRLQYSPNQFWILKQKYDNLVHRWMTEIYVEGNVES